MRGTLESLCNWCLKNNTVNSRSPGFLSVGVIERRKTRGSVHGFKSLCSGFSRRPGGPGFDLGELRSSRSTERTVTHPCGSNGPCRHLQNQTQYERINNLHFGLVSCGFVWAQLCKLHVLF